MWGPVEIGAVEIGAVRISAVCSPQRHLIHTNTGSFVRSHPLWTSLRDLASSFPEDCALPATIPPLHAAHDRAQGRATAARAEDGGEEDGDGGNEGRRPAANRDPPKPVNAKTRIAVFWEEDDGEGGGDWYKGEATSHRKHHEGSAVRWQTRVAYDDHGQYRNFSTWHFLDGGTDSAKWRTCDSSDDEGM